MVSSRCARTDRGTNGKIPPLAGRAEVVLFAIFDDRPESDRTVNRRLIYVGMTRATEELAISRSGHHQYMVDMER